MIVFENQGKLDLLALTTMGLNAKPNCENPIGYFGTGLKYAIAICARLGWELRIETGRPYGVYTVGKKKTEFRNKEIELIELRKDGRDSIQLPFTTELGKNWEPWMVFRELESNVQDEGGCSYYTDELPSPSIDTVRFVVTSPEFELIYRDRDKYFWNSKKQEFSNLYGALSYENKGSIFYRGILVAANAEMPFSFNVLGNHKLTEDRTFLSTWFLASDITSCIVASDNDQECRNLILSEQDSFYSSALNAEYIITEPDSYAHKLLERLLEETPHRVNADLRLAYKNKHKKEKDYNVFLPTDYQKAIIEKVQKWMADRNMKLPEDTEWVTELPKGTLGQVFQGKIYIAQLAYEHGYECVLCTAVEEWVHHNYGYKDMSRDMQDFLLRAWIKESIR